MSASRNAEVNLWQPSDFKRLKTLDFKTNSEDVMWDLCYLRDSYIIFCVETTLKILDFATNTLIKTIDAHKATIRCLAVIDDNTVVSGGWDGIIKIWDVENFENIFCSKQLVEPGSKLSRFCKVTRTILISSDQEVWLRVWNLKTSELQRKLVGHTKAIACIAKINSFKVASGSHDQTIKIWNIDTGECLATLEGHQSAVLSLTAIDLDTIASGSSDNTIKIWFDGKLQTTLTSHNAAVSSLCLLADKILLSGSYDYTVKIWNLMSAQCFKTLVTTHKNFISKLIKINKSE